MTMKIKTAARKTATVAGSGLLGALYVLAAVGEEAARQEKIQQHVDALNELAPDHNVVLFRKNDRF